MEGHIIICWRDRSAGRLTSGQRTAISQIESASAEQRNGSTYWVYEHTSVVSHQHKAPSLHRPMLKLLQAKKLSVSDFAPMCSQKQKQNML